MVEQLEQVLKDYTFSPAEPDQININDLLADSINYIKKLESDIKGLEDIIDIQRHNLALMRKKLQLFKN